MTIERYEATVPTWDCYETKEGLCRDFSVTVRVEPDVEGVYHAEVKFSAGYLDGTLSVCLGRDSEYDEELKEDVDIDHAPRVENIICEVFALLAKLDAEPRGSL